MAHADLDELMNAMLPLAPELLRKHGEFLPFAGSMSSSGEIAHVAGYTEDERPSSQEVINLLTGGLRKQAKSGDLRAGAICLDVRTVPPDQTDKTDAICVRLEHSNGEAVHVFLPYRKRFLGKHKFGDLFAATGERDIFGSSENFA